MVGRHVVPTVLAYLAVACGAEATIAEEDDGAEIAREVCELMATCVSSLVSVEECTEIQVGCRDLLDHPDSWDEHMLGCVDQGGCGEGGGAGGAQGTALVECVAEAPRPAECEPGRP